MGLQRQFIRLQRQFNCLRRQFVDAAPRAAPLSSEAACRIALVSVVLAVVEPRGHGRRTMSGIVEQANAAEGDDT
jgi:hypothetical protein